MREDAHEKKAPRLAALVVAVLVTAGCAGGESQGLVDHNVALVLCTFLVRHFGIAQPSDPDYFEARDSCIAGRFNDKSLPGLDLADGAEPPEWDPLDGAALPAKARVMRAGESRLFLYGIAGRVAAGKFPKAVVAVPYERIEGSAAGTVDVTIDTMVLTKELEPAKKLFGSMKVVLRAPDVGGGGGPAILGEATTTLTKKGVGGSVEFGGVEPLAGLEAVVSFAGGAVRDATLVVSASASVPAADPAAALAARGLAAGRPPAAGGSPVGDFGSPVAGPVGPATKAKKVAAGPGTALAFYRVEGTVRAKKFPKMVLDLPAPAKGGKNKLAVDVGVSVMTRKFKVPKAAVRPQSFDATLFSVKKSGKAQKLGTKSGKVDKSGGASLRFKKIPSPAKGGHLRVVLKMKGKKVENALILISGGAA